MKTILEFLKSNNIFEYKYTPKTRLELESCIKEICLKEGPKANLNVIDTGNIARFDYLFSGNESYYKKLGLAEPFNGDISKWNMSKAKTLSNMFADNTKFNNDISKWNVSNVVSMRNMFLGSCFNNDISKWNVNKVDDFASMFEKSKFDQDISSWNVQESANTRNMFKDCAIQNGKNLPSWI